MAKGALEFLARRRANLPTWRDRVPDLFLELHRGRRIHLFKSTCLSPGQKVDIAVKETFLLEAGAAGVRFPLIREQVGGSTFSIQGTLAHPSFPLQNDVQVRLHVAFRYAEDAFRVRVTPSTSAPFDSIEFEWHAGQEQLTGDGLAELKRSNEPPNFPSLSPWADLDPAIANQFATLAGKLDRAFDETNGQQSQTAPPDLKEEGDDS